MNKSELHKLDENKSIQVRNKTGVLFESKGKWLYPLFELEDFIEENNIDPLELILHDRIAGRAAASLIAKMGIIQCEIDLLSRLAIDVFEKHGVTYRYLSLVEKINCQTEELITSEMPLDTIYSMLKKNAGLNLGVGLKIDNLHVSYNGNSILSGVNLSLQEGEKLVITGDNGTGKTTLLRTIIGAVEKKEGQILVNDKLQKRDRSSLIGYVHQSYNSTPFPVSTEEIVAAGLAGQKIFGKKMKYKVEIAMRRTGSFHLKGRNFYTLSGGEKQRVSLARCLCQRAGLILMDEPTSFLDQDAKDELLDVLHDITYRHAPTMLIVSHDHEWIRLLGWKVKELKDKKLC